ncbi:MAG: D-glycerate dehydrogenase [Thermodesulfobacteriota bacterium]
MKILITGRIPESVLADLKSEHEVETNPYDRPMARADLLAAVKDKDGLLAMVTDRIDRELLDRGPKLRMIANCAVGYDNIDLAEATARKIPVSNTPGVLTDATADLTFGLILAVARRILQGDKRVRAGEFRHWAPLLFLGTEVHGKTLGIVGLGKIGQAVAKRARGFSMRVLYHNRRRREQSTEMDLGVDYRDLPTLLGESDFVSLHVPLSAETRHLIAAEELGLMKRSALLFNVSRGPVVDEKALVEALRSRTIAGAGLDVYEHEPALTPGLTDLDNVVLLPHVGSATIETRTAMARLAAENLLAGLKGEVPPNCLNCRELGRDRR